MADIITGLIWQNGQPDLKEVLVCSLSIQMIYTIDILECPMVIFELFMDNKGHRIVKDISKGLGSRLSALSGIEEFGIEDTIFG